MGIYGALSSAVSGLRAQSHALENISGNIANSQTIGYKRTETSFIDLVPDAPLARQVPGAVLAQSRATNNIRGDIQSVASETYIALNSSGFFIVEPKAGQADGNAVFSGANFYTRRGDFELDKDGRLVNGAGYYLKGLPVDSDSGNISGSVPGVIQVSNSFLPAEPTSAINYEANLPQIPKTGNYVASTPGSELLLESDFADPAAITQDDADNFLKQTISGGAITVYSENGAPVDVQMRWAKVQNADTGGDVWRLYYMSDSREGATDPAWTAIDPDFEFGADGSLTAPTDTELTVTGMTVNGVEVGGAAGMSLRIGSQGISQFSDPNGTANVTTLSQNGYGAGEFISVGITDNGRVVATYSNGERMDLYQVVTADFNAANKLKRHDGGVYSATAESGEPILDTAGSGIIGAALEASNTDISDEFTKLIVTQQAYAAGTRIVSTADEMLQEALNMIR
jgi:flagellar hook protein FlgE